MSQQRTENGRDLNPSSDLVSLGKPFLSGSVFLNGGSQFLDCNAVVKSVSYLEAEVLGQISSLPLNSVLDFGQVPGPWVSPSVKWR